QQDVPDHDKLVAHDCPGYLDLQPGFGFSNVQVKSLHAINPFARQFPAFCRSKQALKGAMDLPNGAIWAHNIMFTVIVDMRSRHPANA
ncbi:MAG: hypothetical protein LLG01_08070, partial [Planctomycetaceae bacterium]|nr:hypothetical protein [Planctomycetaceae bacterium]